MTSPEATLKQKQVTAARGTSRSDVQERAVWLICLFAVVAGIQFRLLNLGVKQFNCEEQLTRIQLEGRARESELKRKYDRYVTAGSLLDRGHVSRHSTAVQTLDACRFDTPFMPPLYFLMARFWAEWFGTDPSALRSLSALISLLEIPFWYLLGIELFESAPAAAILTALGMVSPYYLRLAQFARPYSLWLVLTLLSSLFLLRATRAGIRRSWIAYAAVSTLSLYTHLSALRVSLSDVVYGFIQKMLNHRFKLMPLLCAVVVTLLLFSPWLVELHEHLYPNWRGLNWFTGEVSQKTLWWAWLCQMTELFLDVNDTWSSTQVALTALVPLLEAAIVVVFVRSAPKRSIIFLLTMLGTSFFTLALPDLIWGGGRSQNARYMMPAAVCLQCMIGFALSAMIGARRKFVSATGMFLFIALIAAGTISCLSVPQTRVWWHGWGRGEIAAASVINQCRAPILLGWQAQGAYSNQLLQLVEELRPDVTLAFSRSQNLLPVPAQASDVFLWNPTPEQIRQLEGTGLSFVRQGGDAHALWKLVRP